MWEAINAAGNFEVDPTTTHVFVKFVFINEFLSNAAGIDADIFGAVQLSLEVEVVDVQCDVFGPLV